jgi:hypothetical protein
MDEYKTCSECDDNANGSRRPIERLAQRRWIWGAEDNAKPALSRRVSLALAANRSSGHDAQRIPKHNDHTRQN